jgi:E3 ubiquitin-protein ligase HUWE1
MYERFTTTGVPVNFHDLESADPHFYKSLKWMMHNNIDNVLDLTFEVEHDEFGRTKTVELKRGGNAITVTDENKDEYVYLMTDFKLTGAIVDQLNAFLSGFHELIPRELISIFSPEEMELLMCGLPDVDIQDMKANTDYVGWGPHPLANQTIQWFWQLMSELDQQEKALMLLFVTGTSKVPINGFAGLQGMNGAQKFSIHNSGSTFDKLPTAHTCFNQLDLPEYSSYEAMKQQVMIALREGSQGFGFA